MTNFKLRGRCISCRKTKWFVWTRQIYLNELQQTATSKDVMCQRCYNKVNKALKKK